MIPFVIPLERSETPGRDFLQLQDHMYSRGFIRLCRGDRRREFTDKCAVRRQSENIMSYFGYVQTHELDSSQLQSSRV